MRMQAGGFDADAGGAGGEGGRILFSGCKGETHTHKNNFKQLYRRLRSMYKPEKLDNKEDFNYDNLSSAAMLVFGCPKEKFSTAEFNVMTRFVQGGGSILVMLSEGGEGKAGTNINYWLVGVCTGHGRGRHMHLQMKQRNPGLAWAGAGAGGETETGAGGGAATVCRLSCGRG